MALKLHITNKRFWNDIRCYSIPSFSYRHFNIIVTKLTKHILKHRIMLEKFSIEQNRIIMSNKAFVITVESRFLKPPRETKIGSRNREFEISEVKLQWNKLSPRETTFGSSYLDFLEIEGSRNEDSTVIE